MFFHFIDSDIILLFLPVDCFLRSRHLRQQLSLQRLIPQELKLYLEFSFLVLKTLAELNKRPFFDRI